MLQNHKEIDGTQSSTTRMSVQQVHHFSTHVPTTYTVLYLYNCNNIGKREYFPPLVYIYLGILYYY